MPLTKRALAALLPLACSALMGIAPPAFAQPYPNRQVTIVVPIGPGTEVDWSARAYAPKLADLWKVPVVVDNRVGAGGDIGIGSVAKSAPDGYTLLMTGGSFAINPAVIKSNYDPIQSFKPVMLTAISHFAFVVSSKVRATTLADFVKEAKAAPGQFNYSSPGNGTVQHLTMELFKKEAGVSITHIPYKTAGAAISDLAGGTVDAAIVSPPQVVDLQKAGRVRILALLAPARAEPIPAVPTVVEAGYPGAVVPGWSAMLAPAGTPADILDKLSTDMRAVREMPEMINAFTKRSGHSDNGGGPPERLGNLIEADFKRWKAIAAEANIKPD